MTLGGRDVLLWKPDTILDDTTGEELDVSLGFAGMCDEVKNLEDCQTGQVIDEEQFLELKRQHPNLRLISSRWVSAYKSAEKVRTRVVAKDFNRGESAKSLGYSSPTPSIESLHLVLAACAARNYRLRGLDIGHAFMNSPLAGDRIVILRLPQSISLPDGRVCYFVLSKALNGLRDASLAWLKLLTETVETTGLYSDEVEPCLYSGEIVDDKGISLGHSIAIVYVDDILLASSTVEAEQYVADCIGKAVPCKTTGHIGDDGGSLTFIGRSIIRRKGSSEILVGVDPGYLTSTFQAYGIDKGSSFVPDIGSILEKTMNDATFKKPLSDESYGRFRRALGKLLWMSQTRHDIKTWLSIIGTQQSAPMHGTEMALRAVLRFLFNDAETVLALPTRDPSVDNLASEEQLRTHHLHTFADASFAPYRFNQRRGISGGIVFFEKGLIRSVAKQQQCTSLSSCESELYALQAMSQDSMSFAKVVHRLLFSLGEIEDFEPVNVWIESDSSSALQLINAVDIPKKSRHIEIRLCWIREQLQAGLLRFRHRPGLENPADIFTKCLSGSLFHKHRFALGMVQEGGLMSDLMDIAETDLLETISNSPQLALVEVCCAEFSALREACETSKIPYVGIMSGMQNKGTINRVRQCVIEWRRIGLWVHIHSSIPCTSGSPLNNFRTNPEVPTSAQQEWPELIDSVSTYLKLGDAVSFELPANNANWRLPETQSVFRECGMEHHGIVRLCRFDVVSRSQQLIGKELRFQSSSSWFAAYVHRYSTCDHDTHAPLSDVSYHETGFYNKKLARMLIHAMRYARREQLEQATKQHGENNRKKTRASASSV